MKTLYAQLQDAGDTVDTLINQFRKAGQDDLLAEARRMQSRLWEAQQREWRPEYGALDRDEEYAEVA